MAVAERTNLVMEIGAGSETLVLLLHGFADAVSLASV